MVDAPFILRNEKGNFQLFSSLLDKHVRTLHSQKEIIQRADSGHTRSPESGAKPSFSLTSCHAINGNFGFFSLSDLPPLPPFPKTSSIFSSSSFPRARGKSRSHKALPGWVGGESEGALLSSARLLIRRRKYILDSSCRKWSITSKTVS